MAGFYGLWHGPEGLTRIAGHAHGLACRFAAAMRAARLAKADLVSGMVGEFPELQGIMGGHYIRASEPVIADAIAAHYRPQGPADSLPASAEGCVVSLADKIDSLVGFFGVGAKPTGSCWTGRTSTAATWSAPTERDRGWRNASAWAATGTC